jgi:hypothetical protein
MREPEGLMEAKALTPRDLFDGKVCYEVPPFQRPYVGNEEDQWQPLWDDIERVTHVLLDAETRERSQRTPAICWVRSCSSICRAPQVILPGRR